MKTIRRNTFETNSSSTHSITILSAEDFNKWEDENLYFDEDKEIFLTKEELYDSIKKEYPEYENDEDIEEFILDNRSEYPKTYERFINDDSLEVDVNHYTSKSGDEIVIICKYGYDY